MNKSRVVTDKRVSQLPVWLWSNSNVLPTSYRRIWEAVREESRPHSAANQAELLVDTKKVFPLLLTSQLPTEVLGYIWGLANQKYAGKLTEQELYVVLALVAVAQTSYPFTNLQVLHLLPGPPEPRLNLSLIYPNAAPSVGPHQDAPHRSDNAVTKNDIQGRSAFKTNSVPSGITIPGLVPNNSQMGETKIDSKTQLSSVSFPKVSEANLESGGPLLPRLDGKTSAAQACSSADANDDFSDFQSAAPIQHAPQSIPMWDSKQGSAIGSRLANHNLGVKKPSEKLKKISSASFSNATKSHGGSRNVFPASEKATLAPVGGKEALPTAERLGDIFPKCALKSQAKTVILKDTAIRNNDPPKSLRNEAPAGASIDKIELPPTSTRTVPGKFGALAIPRDSGNSAQDLMNLQQVEDKYSALRVLVEEPKTVESSGLVAEPIAATSAISQSDDFGDFVSAEEPVQPILTNTSPILSDNSSDPFSDFERLRSSNNVKTPNETSLELGAVSQAFGNLEIEAHSDIYSADEKKEAIIEAEKIKPKEDTISVNSIELGNGTNEVIITRSNSVPSLDLKSFLSPSTEDEQQQMENMHQLIYWEWKQYMESCVLLLQTAANVFGSITSDVVLQEVLASAQGYNFLCNLAEVAAVCRRVNFSHKEMDINIMGFDDILMDIDRIWAEMEPFYANIPIVTELPVWPLHQSESSACCALCLTVVTSGRIVYNDNNYHVTCANLWLNCVNHNLPTLRYPLSSFLTHPMPIASTGNSQI